MRSHPLTCVVLTAVALSAWWAVTAETTPPEAALTVDEMRLELGEVLAGREAKGTFVFRNHGAEDVRIIRAKPS